MSSPKSPKSPKTSRKSGRRRLKSSGSDVASPTKTSSRKRERCPEVSTKVSESVGTGCKRTIPMRVLALGMSRTGTMTVQKALKILGYQNPCHGQSFFTNLKGLDTFTDYLKAKYLPPDKESKYKPLARADFDQVIGDCDAVTDAPCCLFGPELIRAYPEAKVILVERSIDSWHKSFSTQAIPLMYSPLWRFLGFLDPDSMGIMAKFMRTWGEAVLRARTEKEAIANAKDAYREHYYAIRQAAPSDRLLNWDLNDGWRPLCEFLGKPIPDVPLPRENDSYAIEESVIILLQRAAARALKRMAWATGSLTLLLLLAYFCRPSLKVSRLRMSIINGISWKNGGPLM